MSYRPLGDAPEAAATRQMLQPHQERDGPGREPLVILRRAHIGRGAYSGIVEDFDRLLRESLAA